MFIILSRTVPFSICFVSVCLGLPWKWDVTSQGFYPEIIPFSHIETSIFTWCSSFTLYVCKPTSRPHVFNHGSNVSEWINFFSPSTNLNLNLSLAFTEHSNYFGTDEKLGAVAVSIRREKLEDTKDLKDQYQYRLIVRTSEVCTICPLCVFVLEITVMSQ